MVNWSDREAVGRWLSMRPNRNPVIEYLRDGWDSGDSYGSTMGCLFALADVITEIDPAMVPAEWEFRPAMGGSDTDSWEYQTILECMRDEGAVLDDLLKAGRILWRLYCLHKAFGTDY